MDHELSFEEFGSRPPLVTDLTSAKHFLEWCDREIGLGFHPDTRAEDYAVDGAAAFTPVEAGYFDHQMEKAFYAFGAAGLDIYEYGLDNMEKRVKGETE